MPLALSQLLPLIFALSVIATLCLMMRVFTYIDPLQFQKYRLLGLFALLFPGVLKQGGAAAFLLMLVAAIGTFLLGLYLFEF